MAVDIFKNYRGLNMQDLVVVLSMMVPMTIFAIYPGIKVANFLEKKYNLEESAKRKVMIVVTFLFGLTLSLFLHYL